MNSRSPARGSPWHVVSFFVSLAIVVSTMWGRAWHVSENAHTEEMRPVDELIKMVSQKTGLSEEMAKTAVETVVGYLKNTLPAPIGGQIDSLLGGTGQAEGAGGLGKTLGGLFGKK